MAVFAQNERLLRIVFSAYFSHIGGQGVHLALHIRCASKLRFIEYAFVLDEPGGIRLAQIIMHIAEVLSAEGFIAKRPHHDRRMVLIALQHRVAAVQHVLRPLRLACGNDVAFLARDRISSCRAFPVRLVDDVQAVFVAQIVPVLDGSDNGKFALR